MRASSILALLALLAPPLGSGARAQLAPGVIAFAHDDSGSSDPAAAFSNIHLMDAQNPSQQVALTAFTMPPIAFLDLAWSRDSGTLFFSSNFDNGLLSLEENSIYAIAGDATGLRQITGGGVVGGLPGPTGTVTGRVVAPTYANTIPGVVTGCVVSAQGGTTSANCDTDGSFTLTDVPVGAVWVRAQAEVTYPGLGPGGPGLSAGFTTGFTVRAGQTVDAGLITIYPTFYKSIQPSPSPDGTRLVVTSAQSTMLFDGNQWKPSGGNALFVWSTTGAAGPQPIPLPGTATADLADLSGGDWSPVADRIACAATGTVTGLYGSFVLVIGPDGSNPALLYRAPANPLLGAIFFVSETRFSPDGGRIAFVQSAISLNNAFALWADLFVVDADGHNGRQLTMNPAGQVVGHPTWSPDGRFIAFHVATTSQTTSQVERIDLYAIDVTTGAVTPVLTDGRSGWPAWRPGTLPTIGNPAGTGPGTGGGGGGGGGPCAGRAPGVDTARCLLGGLDASVCGSGAVDGRLANFLSSHVGKIDAALADASATNKAKRRAKDLAKARRGLSAIATQAMKAARRKRNPLAGGCRDAILSLVEAVRQAAFGG